MHSFDRTTRIATQIHHVLAIIIQRRNDMPGWNKITVTGATVSKDLSHAKIFVSSFDEKNLDKYLKELNTHSKELRYALAKEVKLRITPELLFYIDHTLTEGPKLSRLIDQAIKSDEEKAKKK